MGRRTIVIRAENDSLDFTIRPVDYPHSVINTEAMITVEKNMLMMMQIDGRSTRGTTFTARDGIIYVSCNRIEDARFIRESVDMMDWQLRNLPAMVNVSMKDNNIFPHVEVRTPDKMATFGEVVKEVEKKGFITERWRLIHTMDRGDRGKTLLILVDKIAARKLMENKRPLRFCLAAFTGNSVLIVPQGIRRMMEGNIGKENKIPSKNIFRKHNLFKEMKRFKHNDQNMHSLKRRKPICDELHRFVLNVPNVRNNEANKSQPVIMKFVKIEFDKSQVKCRLGKFLRPCKTEFSETMHLKINKRNMNKN